MTFQVWSYGKKWFIKSRCSVGVNETRDRKSLRIFPRCDLYSTQSAASAPSTKYRYIKYAVCKMNLKVALTVSLTLSLSLTLCHSRTIFHNDNQTAMEVAKERNLAQGCIGALGVRSEDDDRTAELRVRALRRESARYCTRRWKIIAT